MTDIKQIATELNEMFSAMDEKEAKTARLSFNKLLTHLSFTKRRAKEETETKYEHSCCHTYSRKTTIHKKDEKCGLPATIEVDGMWFCKQHKAGKSAKPIHLCGAERPNNRGKCQKRVCKEGEKCSIHSH